MKPVLQLATMSLATALVGACSAVPNVTVSYYLPKAETTVTVTQSVDCDAKKQHLFFVYSVVSATAYASDLRRKPIPFRLKDLDGTFSDSSATFNFTDDGRLKSVNASTTGETEAIVKSAITMVSAIGAVAAEAVPSPPCAVVAAWGGGKPISLVYARTLTYGPGFVGGDFPIGPAPGNQDLYRELKDSLPVITLHVEAPSRIVHAADWARSIEAIPLTLNETARVALDVKAGDRSIWTGTTTVPDEEKTYDLPIPRAALFGKQTFSLTLSDAGAVTSIGYSKDVGIAGAMNAVGAAAVAAKPGSAADEAAQLKAQADLIAQQQRLVRCKAKPSACT